ncbi:MAG: peptide-methionine (R)-S-oxide reductase MsrB [Planctomycetes bacterium]|nr:peptide-methionine (R)-S-oxide reductase MsrB [Planctomycetota bacterium]
MKAPAQDRVVLGDAEWRKRLTPEQYRICREKGTEPPGSGEYLHHAAAGTYLCVACGAPLFSSKTKYDACGWPSFWDRIGDRVAFNPRTLEATCARCDSHLGHVFDDGPPPTGKRY